MSLPSCDVALLERYFAGDLDAVEHRDFETRVQADPELQLAFDETYDQITEEQGLLALTAARAQIRECMSPATLARRAANELGEEASAMVDAHLACPLCSADYEGQLELGAQARPSDETGPVSSTASWSKIVDWFRGGLRPAFAALVALLLSVATWVARAPGPVMRGDEVRVELLCPSSWRVVAGDPSIRCAPGSRLAVHLRNSSNGAISYAIAVGRDFQQFVPPAAGRSKLPRLEADGSADIPLPGDIGQELYLHVVVAAPPMSFDELEGAWPATSRPGPAVPLVLEGEPRLRSFLLTRD